MPRWAKIALWIVGAAVTVLYIIPGLFLAVLSNDRDFRVQLDQADATAERQAAEIPSPAPAATPPARAATPPAAAPVVVRPAAPAAVRNYLGPLDPLAGPSPEFLAWIAKVDPTATPEQRRKTATALIALGEEAKAADHFKWRFERGLRYEVAPAPFIHDAFEVAADHT